MAAIEAVVFDIGGVLLDWDPRHLYRSLLPDEDELERFLAQVCTMDWNLSLDAGRPFDDAIADLAAEHPGYADLIGHWRRQDEMVAGEVPGTAPLVHALAARGVRLHLLTNMPGPVFRQRWRRYPVLQAFDGAVVSGEEGITKPDPALFAVVLDRLGLEPSTTLFVDDSPANVATAAELGFATHHFDGADALCRHLVALGLA